MRAGPGGFRTHVQHVGALFGEAQPMLDGRCGIQKASAVGKGIGSYVDDAHDASGIQHHLPTPAIKNR